MEDKDIKKLKRYLEDIVEGRDDLLQITEKLITTATLQVEAVSNSQVEALARCKQKDALLMYLIKAVILFKELHNSVFNFIETRPLPISNNVQTTQVLPKQEPQEVQSPSIQDLNDFFKDCKGQNSDTFDFSTSGPKLSNTQVVNDSYFRKPLDNTTLKAICISNANTTASTLDNKHEESASKPLLSNAEECIGNNVLLPINNDNNTTVNPIEETNTSKSFIQINSPTFSTASGSEVFSTSSSMAYQHPLQRIQPPAEIPKQYDTQDMDKIKENLSYLSKKMGFDTAELSKMQNNFSKEPLVSYEYEVPVKEIRSEREILGEEVLIDEENYTGPTEPVNTSTSAVLPFDNVALKPSEKPQISYGLKSFENISVVLNNQIIDAGPSTSTGVRKQKLVTEDLIEFSCSTTDSESCGKVSTWLNNNRLCEEELKKGCTELQTTSEESKFKPNSAIEKLHNIKRHDRNEEAREQAMADMPDIKFVPVETPSVIKNNLGSSSSSENKKKTKKIKDLNKDTCVYEIKKMVPPEPGAICVISHIKSPGEFYLQIPNDASMAYLSNEISEKLESKFKTTKCPFVTKREAFQELGKFCFGYVLENKNAWFRLEVIDWELGCSSPDIDVKAVDYGFRCRTSYTYLRPMTRDLADIPMLAVQCHFPFLYPPGSTYSNIIPEWPQETIEILNDLAMLDDTNEGCSDFKVFEITLAMLEGESLAVDLIPYSDPEADSVRNVLLDFGLATEFMEEFGEHPEIGEFLEDIDELEQPENLNELVLAYDAQDERRVCRFTRNDGTCYKGKNCKLEHITLKDGYTTDKTTVFYTAINDLIFPIVGETVRVLVTGYIDSCTYLVQMVRKPVMKENTSVLMDRDISDLIDAINHPKKIAKYECFKVCPAIGEVILAYHMLSKMWMRAIVREYNYDVRWNLTDLEVYAVDFGDHFKVKLKDARVMLEDYMHLPFQIIQIYLDKYQHKIGCNTKKAKSFWNKHISYKNFIVHIQSNDAPFKVHLTTYKGREIGPTLVKEGFAEKRSMDILVAEGYKVDLY